MERSFVYSALLVGLWGILLIVACSLEKVWWPMFNLFFAVFGCIPYLFGSHRSSGLFGAIGDFVTGVVFVSLFAYPVVLHNADQIGPQTLTLVSLSTISLMGAVAMLIMSIK